MENLAKLLTSVAAVLTALAWPAAFLAFLFIFRKEISSAISKVPNILDRVQKASLAGLNLELDQVADAEIESGRNHRGTILNVKSKPRHESQLKRNSLMQQSC